MTLFNRKKDTKGSKEWFDELSNSLYLYAMAMRESAIKGNSYHVMIKNVPDYMSLIERFAETEQVTQEMKNRIYESSDSQLSQIIYCLKKREAPKREIDFFKQTIKNIKKKLIENEETN